MSIPKRKPVDYNTWFEGVLEQVAKRNQIDGVGESEYVVRTPATIKEIVGQFKGIVDQLVFEDEAGETFEVRTRVVRDLAELDDYDFSNNYLHSVFHQLSIGYDADHDELLKTIVEAADQGRPMDLSKLDMTTNELYTIRIALRPGEETTDLKVKHDELST